MPQFKFFYQRICNLPEYHLYDVLAHSIPHLLVYLRIAHYDFEIIIYALQA